MKKLHIGVCICYWLLWGVGLLSLALSFFVYKNDNAFVLWYLYLSAFIYVTGI